MCSYGAHAAQAQLGLQSLPRHLQAYRDGGGCGRTVHPPTRCAIDAVITYEDQARTLTDVRGGDLVTVTTDTQAGTALASTIKGRQAGR